MIRHIGETVQDQLLHIQPAQDRQLRAGDLGVIGILIQIPLRFDQIVLRGVDVRIVVQAVKRVCGTVETIALAVGLIRHILSHGELVASADQSFFKTFVCKHTFSLPSQLALPATSKKSPRESCSSSAGVFSAGRGSGGFSTFFGAAVFFPVPFFRALEPDEPV